VYASDLNPVAVLINKALIEIPPKFAGRPPVNCAARRDKQLFSRTWKGRRAWPMTCFYYANWMRDEAERRIGSVYPNVRVVKQEDGTYRHAAAGEIHLPRALHPRTRTLVSKTSRDRLAVGANGKEPQPASLG